MTEFDRLAQAGFAITMRRDGDMKLVSIVSPQGERRIGHGETISDALFNGLVSMVIKLEEYLVQAERDRDMYKAGGRKMLDPPESTVRGSSPQ